MTVDFPDIPERLPARLTAAQTAAILGFKEHDVAVLIGIKMLKPLGNPKPQSVRFFSRSYVLELAENAPWLAKATDAIYLHWQKKNAENGNERFSVAQIPMAALPV